MKTGMSVAVALFLTTGVSAQVAGVPTQITGTPPARASEQIFNESARSYYSPTASSTVDTTLGGGWSAEKKAKLARFHAEKLARRADKAGSYPS